jgi:hypothetical protein
MCLGYGIVGIMILGQINFLHQHCNLGGNTVVAVRGCAGFNGAHHVQLIPWNCRTNKGVELKLRVHNILQNRVAIPAI